METPSQCKLCINFESESSSCKIHDFLPGEGTREDVLYCPSFIEKGSKSEDDLNLLLKYIDDDPEQVVEERISKAVDNILNDYEKKYQVLIVGIARRKIKSIIRMVDMIDNILDKLGAAEVIDEMAPSQALRLLSELNHSVNNDLSFIMKLVNPDTKLQDLQMWVDARSVINVNNGTSPATDMKAEEMLKLSGASRDKIRDAFDALLHQYAETDIIDNAPEEVREILDLEGEGNVKEE